jgi:hypothetical protein
MIPTRIKAKGKLLPANEPAMALLVCETRADSDRVR